MAIKNFCLAALLSLSVTAIAPSYAQDNPFGQTFQINTRLSSYTGKPSWLIIITDVQTGQVIPYLYDITENDSFRVNFTFAHAYRVTASELQFGPPEGSIHNFCHLQNGIYRNESLVINLSGDLTIDGRTSECHVMRYKEYSFPITQNDQSMSSGSSGGVVSADDSSDNLTNPLAALSSLAGPAASVLSAAK
jgi:hypothetical protein